MTQYARFFLPAACFLLLTVFFLLLPPLRSCRLTDKSDSRLGRADALLMAVLTLLYAVCAFTGLGNRRKPWS